MLKIANYFDEYQTLIYKNKFNFSNEIERTINNNSLIIKIKEILQKENFNFAIRKIEALLININIKRITILTILCSIILCYKALAKESIPAFVNEPEFVDVQSFIKYIIMVIRTLASSVCGLLSAKTGLKVLTDDNVDASREAKKTFQKILWALFLVFAGTALAALLAKKLLYGINV